MFRKIKILMVIVLIAIKFIVMTIGHFILIMMMVFMMIQKEYVLKDIKEL